MNALSILEREKQVKKIEVSGATYLVLGHRDSLYAGNYSIEYDYGYSLDHNIAKLKEEVVRNNEIKSKAEQEAKEQAYFLFTCSYRRKGKEFFKRRMTTLARETFGVEWATIISATDYYIPPPEVEKTVIFGSLVVVGIMMIMDKEKTMTHYPFTYQYSFGWPTGGSEQFSDAGGDGTISEAERVASILEFVSEDSGYTSLTETI